MEQQTFLRWLVGVASSAAFVLGAGMGWVWLSRLPTAVEVGLEQNSNSSSASVAAAREVVVPAPASTVAQPISAPGTAVAEHSAVLPGERRSQPSRSRTEFSSEPHSSLSPLARAVEVPQDGKKRSAQKNRQNSAGKASTAGKSMAQNRAAPPKQATQGVRAWQQQGAWVLLMQRGESQQAHRIEKTRQQLASLVPEGLQLVVVSPPGQRTRLLVLGPFPSEAAAGEALWALPTPFLLKQPQVVPARALF